MYGIIMAGGAGSRLWPRSRTQTPKQLLDLLSPNSLLQETVNRLRPLMPLENIVLVTGEQHAAAARDQLPDLPPANILAEPAARGTAPAIGLGLIYIARLAAERGEGDPVIGSFHADHVITDVPEFQAVVRDAATLAAEGCIVTLGITPSHPHTGYGYIERGDPLPYSGAHSAYRVVRFVEKPPRATAEAYLATGHYSWNSGMFLWQLSTIMDEYATHQPQLYQQLQTIAEAAANPDYAATLARIWTDIRTETIDVGIAEQSAHMAVIPADFGWSDIGDWSVVADLLAAQQANPQQNAVVGHHIGLDTHNSLVYSTVAGKLIATVGVNNLLIVDTGDALLICDRARNQDVKKVVEQLRAEKQDQLL
jgi:mannose-1-phosphate guanylyltransferase